MLSDGELFWIIENGVRFTGMPAFGGVHRAQDSWNLVLFIRHLPQLTMEERAEMERKALDCFSRRYDMHTNAVTIITLFDDAAAPASRP